MSTFKGQLKTSSGDILYPQTSIDKVTGFPTTSAGDLIYGGTGGELTTLAAGTNGQILKSSNGAPQWGANIPEKTQGIFYAQVDSTSTSTNFTVTIPELTATEYYDGLTLLLYNGKVTSASGFTINVNGLGAKPSYSNMALGNSVTPTDPTRDTTIFNINYAMLFTYNSTRVSGGCWICYRGYDANTIGYQVRTNNSTLKASDKFYRYRLLFTSADGTKWVPANTSTSTNATSARNVNQRPIDPFGEIVWYGTTTAIEANANVTADRLWQQYYGTYTLIGYSFNNTGAAATMTANRPIYIKCTPQSNGSAIIDANTPYVQALPSTDDGKIYIFLGRAVSATAFEILLNHPVYYHKDGAIRVWTNPQSGGMANPMTALGDMIYGDAGADPIKLSIGTSGQVLTSDGSIPYWATPVDTNTTYTLNVSGTGDNANKVGLVAGGSGSGTTWYTIPYATNAGSANSVAWSNVSGHADGVKTDIGIESSGTTFLRKDGTWATPTAGMSNPMTTQGDIIVGGTSGAPTRLAGGASNVNKVLTIWADGEPHWDDIHSSSIDTTGINAGQVLTADGSGGASWQSITHPSDIFEATYGTTSYSDILNAAAAGKICIVKYSDLIYELSYNPLTGGVVFTCVNNGVEYAVWVDDTDTWGNSSTNIGTVKKVNDTSPDANGNVSITIPTYNFSGTTFYSGNQNTAEHNANNMTKNGVYYIGSSQNGPPTTLGVQNADSSCHVQAYNDSWVTQLAQDYRDGQIFVRAKKNNVWQNWMAVPFFTTTDGGKGSATKPVYISNQSQSASGSTNGQILECTYSLNADVPSNAVFTDTNQTVKTSSVTFGGSDAVEIVGGTNITVTGNAANKTITIDGDNSTIPLSRGGTGIDAGSVQTWYTSTTLHPHFQVTFVNNQWTCVYLGPTEGITDIVSALDSQYVKYALSQVVPVVSGTVLVFNGVIVSNALGLHAEQIDILFPDMIAYGGALVNGISGTLTWSSADGLYLSNIAIHTPGAVTYASSIVSAATGLGTSAIGSSTQPVYWTGSAFAATTNSLPSVTSADAGKILTVDSNGNWVAVTMAQWQLGGNY